MLTSSQPKLASLVVLAFLQFTHSCPGADPMSNPALPVLGPDPVPLTQVRERILGVNQSWGTLGYDTGTYGAGQTPLPLRIADREYAHGLGTHAQSEIRVWLGGQVRGFRAEVGLQTVAGVTDGSVVYRVLADGREVFATDTVRRGMAPIPVDLEVRGVDLLTLVVEDAGDGFTNDGANWGLCELVPDPDPDPRVAVAPLDLAPFAEVLASDPERRSGTPAGRLEEFPAEDLFLETPVGPRPESGWSLSANAEERVAIGLLWAERRVLDTVTLRYTSPRPLSPQQVRVEYWSSEGRVDGQPDWSVIGQTRWQGSWAELPGDLDLTADQVHLRIDRSSVPEFLNRNGTLKVRWIVSDPPADLRVTGFSAISACSPGGARVATLRLSRSRPGPETEVPVSVYNGYVLTDADARVTQVTWNPAHDLELRVVHTPLPQQPDNTSLRFGFPEHPVCVAVLDALAGEGVHVPAAGLRVTRADDRDPVTGAEDLKTVRERLRFFPDQRFEAAMDAMLRPEAAAGDPILLSTPCDNRKFVIEREGSVERLATDFAHMDWRSAGRMEVRVGSADAARTVTRALVEGWRPVPVTRTQTGGLEYEQTSWVAATAPWSSPREPIRVPDKVVGCVRWRVRNSGHEPGTARLQLRFLMPERALHPDPDGAGRRLHVEPLGDGQVRVLDGDTPFAVIPVADAGPWTTDPDSGLVTWSPTLEPDEELELTVLLPGQPMAWAELAALDPESLLQETRTQWAELVRSGLDLEIPEARLLDVIRASVVHCHLAARSQDQGRLVEPWIGSVYYGPLDTESQGVVRGMDAMGQAPFSRAGLEYFLSRYNRNGMLANGYTIVGTGQHLWTLAEHYRVTRDREWLEQITPQLLQACDWILDQCAKTRATTLDGQPLPESGLLPPGVLADWNRYAYFFFGQGWYHAGLAGVAACLADTGHERAPELMQAAEDLRRDIRRAFAWTQARMPVTPLQNHTWGPNTPSSLYCFGRTADFYGGLSAVGHDVEVGGAHLLLHGVFGAEDTTVVRGMLDRLEDAWYSYHPGIISYPPEQMRERWFTLGGFSKLQQYYTRSAQLYAVTGERKAFIRSYFNAVPCTLSSETLAFWEHFFPGCWNKTAETGWFLEQTRLMFAVDTRNELRLAPFVPESWLEQGSKISARRIPTRFGPVSFVLRSDTDHGRITATVALTDTDRAPERLVLTLPHPDGCPILKAELEDGTPLRLTTDARAVVLERPAAGELRIEARFRSGYARLTDWDVREWHNPQVPPEWGAYRLSYTSPADGLQDWALVCPGRRGDTSRWLVYIHGHGSTGDQLFTRPDVVAGRLLPMRELGLPILSVNLRGNAWMGPEAVADLHAVLEWCRNRYGVREFHFASASMGGTSNLIYAVRHPGDVASVAAGCPATDLAAYHRWLAARRDNGGIRDQIRTAIEAAYGGTPDQRPEVYTQHSVLGNAQRLTMPVFLDHGAADGLIPVEQSRALAQACGDRAGFAYTEYPGGDHDEPLRHAAVLDWLRAQLGTAE